MVAQSIVNSIAERLKDSNPADQADVDRMIADFVRWGERATSAENADQEDDTHV